MAFPRYLRSRQMVKARRTSGNITLNSTTWANVDTGLDLTLNEVQVDDEIVYGISCVSGAESEPAFLDVVTVVSSTATNSFSEQGAVVTSPGARSFFMSASVNVNLVGSFAPYTVVAGDLTSGSVTLRLRYATNAANNRTLNASTDYPLDVWAVNLGPLQG